MYANVLKNLFASDYFNNVRSSLNGGKFSIVNEGVAHMKLHDETFRSHYEITTDFQACVMEPTVREVTVRADHSGYNRAVLSDDGNFSFDQAYSDYIRRGTSVRISNARHKYVDATQNDHDSQEAYLLNMLISWFKACLFNGKGAGVHPLLQTGFKDSHVEMKLPNGYGSITHDVVVGPPAPSRLTNAFFRQRGDENYWDRPYVVKFNSATEEQTAFYLIHVLGREGDDMLSVNIDIETLPLHAALFEPCGLEIPETMVWDIIDWTAPERIYSWIRDYVVLNRCYKAFSAAMDTLGAIAMHPNPSYHESSWWNSVIQNVNLAPFCPTRARVPTALDGEATYDSSVYVDFFNSEAKDPMTFMFNSAVVNYGVWMAMYSLLANASEDYDDWTVVLDTLDEDFRPMRGVDSRAELFSLLTGQETRVMMTENCYVDWDLSLMSEGNTEVIFEKTLETNYPQKIQLNRAVPYVSGAMFMGVVLDDMPGYQHLASNSMVTIGRDRTISPDDVIKLATTYRIFGHELAFRLNNSGKVQSLWANHRELVPPKFDLLDRLHDTTNVYVVGSSARAGRHDTILTANLLRAGETVCSFISRPLLKLTTFGSRVEKLTVATRTAGKKKLLLPLTIGGTRATRKTVKSRKITPVKYEKDFRDETTVVAPSNPVTGEGAPILTEEEVMQEDIDVPPAE